MLIKSKLSCDEEFFRLTRRKREGVVRYVERVATLSDGKRTVTVRVFQQTLAYAQLYAYDFPENATIQSADGKYFWAPVEPEAVAKFITGQV